MLLVEPAGRGGVARALDVAGLDLQVGHGVRAGALGEDEVAVELVRVDAQGVGTDEDVAHPHGARVRALQRTLVHDVRRRLGRGVVDVGPVLEVLTRVREVQAQELRLAAGAGVADVRVEADDVAAQAHRDVAVGRVAAHKRIVLTQVDGPVLPHLERREREARPVAHDDGEQLRVARAALVLDDDGRPCVGAHRQHRVRVDGAVAGAVRADDDRLVELGAVRDRVVDDLRCAGGREGSRPVLGCEDPEIAGGLGGERRPGDPVRQLRVDRQRGGRGLLAQQVGKALDRGEAPLLLATGDGGEVGEVEAARPVLASVEEDRQAGGLVQCLCHMCSVSWWFRAG